jgi:hypothetical protein
MHVAAIEAHSERPVGTRERRPISGTTINETHLLVS